MKLEDDIKNGHMELGCKNCVLFFISKAVDLVRSGHYASSTHLVIMETVLLLRMYYTSCRVLFQDTQIVCVG